MLCWLLYESGQGPIFGFGNRQVDTSGSSANKGITLEINENEIAAIFFKNQHSPNPRSLSHPIELAGMSWKFVGASYDHRSGKANLWVDGDEVKTKDIGAGHELATEGNVIMGEGLEIKITQMHVYKLALTKEQVQTIQKRTQIPG